MCQRARGEHVGQSPPVTLIPFLVWLPSFAILGQLVFVVLDLDRLEAHAPVHHSANAAALQHFGRGSTSSSLSSRSSGTLRTLETDWALWSHLSRNTLGPGIARRADWALRSLFALGTLHTVLPRMTRKSRNSVPASGSLRSNRPGRVLLLKHLILQIAILALQRLLHLKNPVFHDVLELLHLLDRLRNPSVVDLIKVLKRFDIFFVLLDVLLLLLDGFLIQHRAHRTVSGSHAHIAEADDSRRRTWRSRKRLKLDGTQGTSVTSNHLHLAHRGCFDVSQAGRMFRYIDGSAHSEISKILLPGLHAQQREALILMG
mmetsp:Transcript_1807/g.5488  ORF Transcript_1807/g.5488 Transcript_1807/m.5488 type:complete len:316 (-) Transcript_1807:177-1124(-)